MIHFFIPITTKMHPWVISHCLIRTHVDNLSLKTNCLLWYTLRKPNKMMPRNFLLPDPDLIPRSLSREVILKVIISMSPQHNIPSCVLNWLHRIFNLLIYIVIDPPTLSPNVRTPICSSFREQNMFRNPKIHRSQVSCFINKATCA